MHGAIGYKNDYGAFLYCGMIEGAMQSEQVPADVKRIMEWADHSGYVWIKLDVDAPEVEGLEVYDEDPA